MRTPDFWYSPRARADLRTRLTEILLSPFAALYDLGGRARHAWTETYDPGVPVICVGNLTAGGTGKTPLVIAIAHGLKALGHRPHILTRGYGGRFAGPLRVDPGTHKASDVGDEPLLLAAAAPTWIARDRSVGARSAVQDGAELLIMDDGHQNPSLKKTLALVVVDGEVGFGNARVIPAGPLREGISRGLGRADAIVIMGEPSLRTLGQLAIWRGPVFHARLEPKAGVSKSRPLLAFAGIGRPEKFFATLESAGATLVGRTIFPDHHMFSASEFDALAARAKGVGARLITTEKDAVRLSPDQREHVDTLLVCAVVASHEAFGRFLIEHLASRSRMLRSAPADI